MILTTKELFRVAYGRFAIGAFNINNMEQALGLFGGNLESQAPFIVQISRGARKYANVKMIETITRSVLHCLRVLEALRLQTPQDQ